MPSSASSLVTGATSALGGSPRSRGATEPAGVLPEAMGEPQGRPKVVAACAIFHTQAAFEAQCEAHGLAVERRRVPAAVAARVTRAQPPHVRALWWMADVWSGLSVAVPRLAGRHEHSEQRYDVVPSWSLDWPFESVVENVPV